ncbi:Tn3 family transposase [Clostridium sp. FP1]|uniref:Tn3 family transposase n=1 Tax=Clostridium sp. FP1 TaxID=2724076 RepID=UPI0013E927EA|nr:Tn3 family transposase [Clostridium sp. FP1]MBZ9637722.1 transposase [Clostridium sp. FP1]
MVALNTKLDLAKIWGGGEVASADGLRFVTLVRTINSRSNSKYFGAGRGVTYYNFTSHRFTGFNGIVIPGTIRDTLGTINSTQLIQTLQREGKPTMIGRALGEFGRIYKTQYLLTYVDDSEYRRRILTQLNHGESRHSLGRAVFHGKRGELHQPYKEGQEDQLSALGLIVNAIVVWNTRYMEVAIDSLHKTGHNIPKSDIQRLSPLGYEHINIMGRYSFIISKEIENGILRPLMTLENEIG